MTLAELRRMGLLTLEQRKKLRLLDFNKVWCYNSVGNRVCILAFHPVELNQAIKELEDLVRQMKGYEIWPRTGKTVVLSLATFISFKLKRAKGLYPVVHQVHHENFTKPPKKQK